MFWMIGWGTFFLIAGLSGKGALKGTDSSGALAAIGAGLVFIGLVRVVLQVRRASAYNREYRALFDDVAPGEPDGEDQFKTCPECAEEIRVGARKYRFCGSSVPVAA